MPGTKGNRNAVKHGFYARHFTAKEKRELGKKPDGDTGLNSEVDMLRVLASRILHDFDAGGKDYADPDNVPTLGAIIACASRVNTIIRTEHIITGEDNQTYTAIMEAIAEIEEEEIPHLL